MENEGNQRLTIDVFALADELGISAHAIRQHRSGVRVHPLLIGLPEPAMTRPRLVWWSADIRAWVDSRRTFRPAEPAAEDAPAARRRGRPRLAAAGGGV